MQGAAVRGSAGAQLIFERETRIDGRFVREFTFCVEHEGERIYVHTRAQSTSFRAWILQWAGKEESINHEDVQAFFNSFGLGDPPPLPPGVRMAR
jgi:hypothetical protein